MRRNIEEQLVAEQAVRKEKMQRVKSMFVELDASQRVARAKQAAIVEEDKVHAIKNQKYIEAIVEQEKAKVVEKVLKEQEREKEVNR